MLELSAPVLWLTLRRGTSSAGRACRDYACRSADGTPVFAARAWNWRREIACVADETTVLLLRRRVSFPLSGRVDIAGADGRRTGVVRRNGRVDGAGGLRGRFRDVRSARKRLGESVLATLVETALGGEGAAETSSASEFVFLIDDEPAATLLRARPPWAAAAPTEPSAGIRGVVARSVDRLRSAVGAGPLSWRLERTRPIAGDAATFVGAALVMVELSQW